MKVTKRKNMQKSLKNNEKGITLVALVVTIVVLLILAGISLNLVLGNNGIIAKAKDAKENTARAGAEEKVGLEVAGSYGTDGYIDMPLLNENLKHIKGLTYNGAELSDTNKIESLPATVVVDGYEVIIDEKGGSTILGDIPEHPELSGYDWFVVGETEPNPESKDIAEYFIKSGYKNGTLIIYPRNGKNATITASDLELKTIYGVNYYLPQWSAKVNKELAEKITSVYVAPQVSTEYAAYFFYGLENCEKMDITNLETSKVTDMSNMFYCEKVVEIKGSEKLNISNVTNMECMFDCCRALKNLDTTGWDVSKVENMDYLFDCCTEIETIKGLANWDVSNVKSMTYLFDDCHKIKNLEDVKDWDTSKVESMWGTFGYCNIESMDWISNWDVSSVQDFCVMFQGNPIKSLDLSKWDTSNATCFRGLFAYCSDLTTINMQNWDTAKVEDMMSMFAGCEMLTILDLSGFNTTNVTDMSGMFSNCKQLTKIWSGPNWSDSQANKRDMFLGCGTTEVTPKV